MVSNEITDSVFISISLDGHSALSFNINSPLNITNCFFMECCGESTSGAINYETNSNCLLKVESCSIISCSGTDGFALRSKGDTFLHSSIIHENYMSQDSKYDVGSSITIFCNKEMDLISNNITNNYSQHRTGFYINNGIQNAKYLVVFNNTANSNGVILQFAYEEKTTEFCFSVVFNNTCNSKFSTLRAIKRTLNIYNCTIFDNKAQTDFYSEESIINIHDTFIDNDSKAGSGDINFDSTLAFITSIPLIEAVGYKPNKQNTCEEFKKSINIHVLLYMVLVKIK